MLEKMLVVGEFQSEARQNYVMFARQSSGESVPSQPSTCTSYNTTDQIESSQVEDSGADESRKRGKGPKKLAAK